jgi:hypothetical protein
MWPTLKRATGGNVIELPDQHDQFKYIHDGIIINMKLAFNIFFLEHI